MGVVTGARESSERSPEPGCGARAGGVREGLGRAGGGGHRCACVKQGLTPREKVLSLWSEADGQPGLGCDGGVSAGRTELGLRQRGENGMYSQGLVWVLFLPLTIYIPSVKFIFLP